ncbi:MAG: manganese-dependent inorganic pyrophosphatase [Patescibacteria group bacterium]|jgi:manganese-dependent inorganic pyrophosphatase
MVYIIGHKSPDLDSVAAAIALADLKNKLTASSEYIPAVAEDVNKETAYCLEKFGLTTPEKLESLDGKEIVLVDHNEESQILGGGVGAKIVGVWDHHKIAFKCDLPIEFRNLPWGSTCTIIARHFFCKDIKLEKNLAGLLLAAVLVDTVMTKSPTCTEYDREVIGQLAAASGIEDWKAFGLEIFKVRGAVSEMSNEAIIKNDFKDFEFKAGKFGVGQIETVDLNDFAEREDELVAELIKIKDAEGYHSVILFITDIIKEGSKFLIATNDMATMEKALNNKIENNRVYIDGIFSRKKQVIPMMTEIFDK